MIDIRAFLSCHVQVIVLLTEENRIDSCGFDLNFVEGSQKYFVLDFGLLDLHGTLLEKVDLIQLL
jgi:hypothetical protein